MGVSIKGNFVVVNLILHFQIAVLKKFCLNTQDVWRLLCFELDIFSSIPFPSFDIFFLCNHFKWSVISLNNIFFSHSVILYNYTINTINVSESEEKRKCIKSKETSWESMKCEDSKKTVCVKDKSELTVNMIWIKIFLHLIFLSLSSSSSSS